MKKILVTGALGHIGSYLIREFAIKLDNIEVIMLDNMSAQRYCSLFNLPKNCKYTFIEDDILTTDLNKICKDVSYVVHLAAITNAANSFRNEQEVENVNFIGTQRVIKACIENNCKLIFLSSTSVYGTQNDVVDENCTEEELQPQSPYAESKLKSEKELSENKDQLDYVILRFGTIFGHSIGMRFHTAVNKFCWQAVMKQPLSVWETAYIQKRPYLDLHDASNAIIFLIDNNIFNKEIYNVLTDNFTVKDIVDTIKENIENVEVEFIKTEIMNQLSYDVSNNKFKSLGFKFRGDHKIAIQNTIEKLSDANNQ